MMYHVRVAFARNVVRMALGRGSSLRAPSSYSGQLMFEGMPMLGLGLAGTTLKLPKYIYIHINGENSVWKLTRPSYFLPPKPKRYICWHLALGRPGYINLNRAADLGDNENNDGPSPRSQEGMRANAFEVLDVAYARGVGKGSTVRRSFLVY